MAKTSLFKNIQKLMRIAGDANRRGLTDAELKIEIERGLTRREFLKNSALTGTGIAVASQFGGIPHALAQISDTKGLDETVVILGAGAAGLAAAYRLKKARIPYVLIDAQNRVGGRIHTGQNFNKDGQFVEIGAELVDTPHYVLRALAKELHAQGQDVEIEDFAEGDKSVDDEVFHVDGEIYSHAQFLAAAQPLAKKLLASYSDLFVGGDPASDDLTYKNADKLIHMRKYDNLSIHDYLRSCAEGVDAWLIKAVDRAFVGEYGVETQFQPAINLLFLMDISAINAGDITMFGVSDEVSRVKGGNENLIRALHNVVGYDNGKPNQRIRLNQKLTRVEEARDGRLELYFENQAKPLRARQVICALPFTVLRQVDGFLDLALSKVKKQAVRELGIGTNAKLFMSFQDKHWRQVDPKTGYVPGTKKVRATRGEIFTDLPSQCFWETSRLQTDKNGNLLKRGILTNFLGGENGANASEDTVKTALKNLEQIYPGIGAKYEAPAEGQRSSMNWTRNPFTQGSYSLSLLGQWSTIWGSTGEAELPDPVSKRPRLLFAGEHTSLSNQGFMEGGYESGTRAAEEVIASRTGGDAADPYQWAKAVLGIKNG